MGKTMTTIPAAKPTEVGKKNSGLGFLDSEQIAMIDKALLNVGDFGEVRLILEKGCLRFVVVQKSYDVRHWQVE